MASDLPDRRGSAFVGDRHRHADLHHQVHRGAVDPDNPDNKVASFTCQGTGTPAPATVDPGTTPPCGYTYIWKSLTDRTGGTGTWPVTATTHWTVTWTASDGTNGTLAQPLTPQATTQVTIGEWRSTLVAGG